MHWARSLPALLLLPALAAQAQPLVLLVYPNPGVFDVSPRNELSGPGPQAMKRLAEVTGLDLRMQAVPPARALQTALQQPGYCAAGVPRTPERENLYRWAGLMGSGELMLYARADDAREVHSADDLRGAVIVAQRESQPMAWLRQHGLNAYEVNDTITGLRMLRAGRVDFWLVNDLAGQPAIRRADGAAPKASHSFGRIDIHVACHRDLDPIMADRLRRGFEQLRRNGELVEFGLR